MNDLIRTPANALLPGFIEAPATLGAAIRAVRRGTPVHPISAALREAAERHVLRAERYAAPSSRHSMLAWLRNLASSVINPPASPAEIVASATPIWDVCSDLPEGVWTDDTRRAWVRSDQGKFWPMPSELYAHLKSFADTITSELRACREIIANVDDIPDGCQRLAKAERDAILTRFRQQMADLRSLSIENDAEITPVTSTKLPTTAPGQLAAVWRHAYAQGVPGAEVRLRAMGIDPAS